MMKVLLPISCCLLLLLGFLPEHLNAQQGDLRFEHLTIADGLPGTGIIDILQDRQGYLWLATWGGLARYDGYEFIYYNSDAADSTSLTGDFVAALYEDRSGTLWVGTCRGLNRYDRATERFTRYVHNPADSTSLGGFCVYDVFEDRLGYLWVGTTDGGLSRFHPDEPQSGFTRFRHDPSDSTTVSSNGVGAIYEDRAGVLWIATMNGLSRFERETERFSRFMYDPAAPDLSEFDMLDSDTYPANNTYVFLEDRAGAFWAGMMGNGLCRFDRETETFSCYRHSPDDSQSINDDFVFGLAEDLSGNLWVGTSKGLNRFDRTTERFTRYRHVPEDARANDQWILRLYVDRAGILWIGSWNGLLSRSDLANDVIAHYTGEAVESQFEGEDDRVWISTDDGIYRLDRSTGMATPYYHYALDARGVSADEAKIVYEDRSGTLWVAVELAVDSPPGVYGLYRFDPDGSGRFTHYLYDPDEEHSDISALHEDRSGNLWLGTVGDGLKRFDPEQGTFTHYRHDPHNPRSLSGNYVRPDAIYEDRLGLLWVGTTNGLNRFDPKNERFTRYQHDPDDPHSLNDKEVFTINEDRSGVIWVGTYGSLSRLDQTTETFTHYPVNKGALCLLGDDKDRLWISTLRGLARFDPQTETFTYYGEEKGVRTRSFVNGSTCHKNRRGEMFINGNDGFYVFSPDRFRDNPYPPHVILTDLRIFDSSLQPGEDKRLQTHISDATSITLRHHEHDLSINFVGLHYSWPEANRYAYMLEPYDADWREAGTQRSARYTNLDPGDYVFRVKAANVYDVWNEEGATLRITISPPWWKTSWAYVFYMIGLGLLIFVGYEARVHRLKAHALELSRTVKERTKDLLAEKQKTEEQARRLVELDEAKNRFFANISHEFRTPLTLILGPLQDAIDGINGEVSPRLQQQHRLMHRNVRRLLRLINQLLDLSKLDAGKMEIHRREADLRPFLQKLVQSFMPMAERGRITLRFHSEIETLRLGFDADLLEKVFGNLLSNALKFTPEAGKVWVTMNRPEGDASSIVEVIVKDTGPGIAKEDLARIFDRFQQVDASTTRLHEGTGIGLAMVKELVDLHEGTLLVESEPGFGSAFIVRIPISFSGEKESMKVPLDAEERTYNAVLMTDGAAGTVEAAAPQAETDKPTILIVEDNADVRAYLKSHLDADYHVVEAEDGEAGLEAARRTKPDLVLADVMMPRMDGYEMCRALKANDALRSIPVVMLTAKAGEEDMLEGLGCGADDYLAKPFSMLEVKARVENLIASRRALRHQFSREVVVQPAGITIQPEDEVFLNRVLAVIEAHLGDSDFGVDYLAEEMGMSRRHLARRLEAVVDEAPAALIRRLRLERAEQLLKARAGTIAEVAYAVGYRSPSHFSTAFREAFGLSPSEHIENGT